MHPLYTPIEYLKGVGPRKADLLRTEAGIHTFGDLLFYFPFRHIDRSRFHKIGEIREDMPWVQIIGRVVSTDLVDKGRAKRFSARLRDETGEMDLIWFQGLKWAKDLIKPGQDYIIFGKPVPYKGRFSIAHPESELFSDKAIRLLQGWQPVYNSTEKLKASGLDSRGISRLQETLRETLKEPVPESLSPDILQSLKLMSADEAVRQAHTPENADTLRMALYRLKFEELFFVRLNLLLKNRHHRLTQQGFIFSRIAENFNTFYENHLPFPLTNAQKRVLKEIRRDLASGMHMNRLLQGDVGSGKTIVALMAMLMALDNDFQACLMAPTEILATQHFQSISSLLSEMSIQIELLTGSTRQAKRKLIHTDLRSGSLNILIGTHALLEDEVMFRNLGLCIIDEQHRFGVAQRAKLWAKNNPSPHVLVMTATPIPRTLAMTLYGDLDVSVIDELPPGRKPIETRHFFESRRLEMFGFIRREIQKGRQVYIVYPLIEESEKSDMKHLMDGYESISRAFPEYYISIVHGRMKPADKEFEMNRFARNETQIMVATTVIEVGVNVPNASIMIIENAERFGLSQLHQLRGRVGRGADQSYCILMTDYKLSADSRVRMETMVRTNDGFEIAETDLRLRGPGDLQGTQQSGVLDLKIADLAKDQQILQAANRFAVEICETDPELSQPLHRILSEQLKLRNTGKSIWALIS